MHIFDFTNKIIAIFWTNNWRMIKKKWPGKFKYSSCHGGKKNKESCWFQMDLLAFVLISDRNIIGNCSKPLSAFGLFPNWAEGTFMSWPWKIKSKIEFGSSVSHIIRSCIGQSYNQQDWHIGKPASNGMEQVYKIRVLYDLIW